MQTLLVFITFSIAVSFLLKKFVWNPIFEGRKSSVGTVDGGKMKCGKKDCGC